MAVGTYFMIINLYVNGVNAPNQRYRQDEWIQKQDPYVCCVCKRLTSDQGIHSGPESEGWNMIFHANRIQRKSRCLMLILDKTHSKYY